jgi:hypothetical protein
MTGPAMDLFPDQVSTQLTELRAQLNDLTNAMRLAAATGQDEALAIFRTQFRALAARAAALRQEANAEDAPSAVMQALSAFSDAAIKAGEKLGAPVGDLLDSTSLLLKLAPWILVALVGIVAWLAYKGHLDFSADL